MAVSVRNPGVPVILSISFPMAVRSVTSSSFDLVHLASFFFFFPMAVHSMTSSFDLVHLVSSGRLPSVLLRVLVRRMWTTA